MQRIFSVVPFLVAVAVFSVAMSGAGHATDGAFLQAATEESNMPRRVIAEALIDERQYRQDLDRLRGNRDAAQEALNEATAIVDTAATELGDLSADGAEVDFSKIKSISGTAAQKQKGLFRAFTTLAAAQQVLGEMDSLTNGTFSRAYSGLIARPELGDMAGSFAPGFGDSLQSTGVFDTLAQHGGGGAPRSQPSPRNFHVSVPASSVLFPPAVNTLFQRSDGLQGVRRIQPGYTPEAQFDPRITILDIMNRRETGVAGDIRYHAEDVTPGSNDANLPAEKLEGAQSPELDIALSEVVKHIATIRADLPVTQESLDDNPLTVQYLDEAMPRLTRYRASRQLLVGNGTAPNVDGLVGKIPDANKITGAATTSAIDAINDAAVLVMKNGEAVPDYVLVETSVWGAIRKMQVKAGTQADQFDTGQYALGGPGDQEVARSLWDMGVIPTNALGDRGTSNNVWAVLGDFATFGDLFVRKDATVEVGLSADDFEKYLVRYRVVARLQAAWRRAAAFASCVVA